MWDSHSWKPYNFGFIWFVLTCFSPYFHTFCFAGLAIVLSSGSAGDDLLQVAEMDTFSSVSTVLLLAPRSSVAQHIEVRPRTSISLSLSLSRSEGAGAGWPLTFSIPLCCLWVLNGGLRGAEASAWFSRVKTKRLLKIPKSSHDPRKDLDPTCVRFPFHRLVHTKSTYLADLFCLSLGISDNELHIFLDWHWNIWHGDLAIMRNGRSLALKSKRICFLF